MFVNTKRNEIVKRVIALGLGIFIGYLYANISRSSVQQWFYSPTTPSTEVTTLAPNTTTKKVENDEIAQFLVSDDTTVANSLADAIKVLCWVHEDKFDKERIGAINQTWAARCTHFITITNSGHNSTDVFNIPRSAGGKSNIENAYRFIHSQYSDKFDWFLKTGHNLYVVMENLRFKLSEFTAENGVAVGLTKTDGNYQSYLSDEAGYAVNALGLKKLVNGFDSNTCAKADQIGNDERRIGLCMYKVGIHLGKSTDKDGKNLFFDECLEKYLLPNGTVTLPYPWYQEYHVDNNLDKVSNYSITFNDLDWQQMHVMEWLIYKLRPYGIVTEDPNLPEKVHFK